MMHAYLDILELLNVIMPPTAGLGHGLHAWHFAGLSSRIEKDCYCRNEVILK